MDSDSLERCERLKAAIISEARAVFAASLQTYDGRPLVYDVVVESAIEGGAYSYKARAIVYDCGSLMTWTMLMASPGTAASEPESMERLLMELRTRAGLSRAAMQPGDRYLGESRDIRDNFEDGMAAWESPMRCARN